MTKQLQLVLPRPHLAQTQVISQARRFNVLACGRRWGKSTLGIDRAINTALQGAPVGWFAPTYKNLLDVWRTLSTVLQPVIRDKNEAERRLELTGGGVIEAWSMDASGVADSSRGRKYKLIVVDECALVPQLVMAWQGTLRAMLTDLIGSAWFLSTPRGLDGFKELFDRGADPERKDWMSWRMATATNPYIDPSEIEASRQDLSEAMFRQEFEAEFINFEGAVFRNIIACATAPMDAIPERGHTYVCGVDWGKSNDFTVITIIDASVKPATMMAIDRFNKIDYIFQRGRLEALCERWHPSVIIAEENSIGGPIIEELQRGGLPVLPFQTSNQSKKQIVESLSLAFERNLVRILPDPVLLSELQSFQCERLPSGMTRYSASPGCHDDTVVSLCLAGVGIGEVVRSRSVAEPLYLPLAPLEQISAI